LIIQKTKINCPKGGFVATHKAYKNECSTNDIDGMLLCDSLDISRYTINISFILPCSPSKGQMNIE